MSHRHYSLTLRLAVVFALLAYALLATTGVALYRDLERELVRVPPGKMRQVAGRAEDRRERAAGAFDLGSFLMGTVTNAASEASASDCSACSRKTRRFKVRPAITACFLR